jgi:hypothetical protein
MIVSNVLKISLEAPHLVLPLTGGKLQIIR